MGKSEQEVDTICELYQVIDALQYCAPAAEPGLAVIIRDQCMKIEAVAERLEKAEVLRGE